ncbi:helix-turn-helix domain-containing protein [Bacterioplanoides sp. SCSIO 12839]|uniref:helix-turn-helix domain-containing protein n=1 Tax=Bacterioplanoides sp. SCSIO 12839 TaxID=2829569 RepID=UPI0021070E83|nr:helix-turn-helix transcriptional regulator [Bacterioplanoides sp. SCSIO 12839]UTW49807.1 helix-turn-helix transcriptional regulator [Bacterioplanoides sp. SCSIO 12839]
MQKTITSARYQRLIKGLIDRRQQQKISIRELAERLDVAHSFVQRIENLERRLDVYEFVTYCDALGLDPHEGLDILMFK